uniref:Large ribosomal subunit protein uL4c n=1 Tax=Bostrychia simpliciuscula TaxID=324754 RepID=A0A1Z1M8F2_9FLOR|nr:ribosomal protein L4 [Bostrychia simpliciuscula]ARW62121.1 ribosomal protein L4 [Bostrychia simpliciuscula]
MTTTKQIKYSINSIKNNTIFSSVKQVKLKIQDDQSKQVYMIHRGLKQQLTNYRVRKAHTKTRSEVRGGGKKPWKQKGTGKARAGSIRSPLWKGGGVVFGPRKRVYKSKINKKEKKLNIQTVLYNKFKHTIAVDKLLTNLNKPNTKNAIIELVKLGIKINNEQKVLVIIEKKTKILYLSLRNIPNIEIIEIKNLNLLSLLKTKKILITSNALDIINTINN